MNPHIDNSDHVIKQMLLEQALADLQSEGATRIVVNGVALDIAELRDQLAE